MLYVVVHKNKDISFDTLVGVFANDFDADMFLTTQCNKDGRYEIRKVDGHWGDLMAIREKVGC